MGKKREGNQAKVTEERRKEGRWTEGMKGRREEAMVEKRSRLLSIVLTSNPGETK